MSALTLVAPLVTVRKFSCAGPCLTQGRLVRETSKFYVYATGRGGLMGPDAVMVEKKIAKPGSGMYSPAHIVPCERCMDNPKTDYPHGYMD